MPMYDKVATAPWMVAWRGTPDEAGGIALPWTYELQEICLKVQEEKELEFITGCSKCKNFDKYYKLFISRDTNFI